MKKLVISFGLAALNLSLVTAGSTEGRPALGAPAPVAVVAHNPWTIKVGGGWRQFGRLDITSRHALSFSAIDPLSPRRGSSYEDGFVENDSSSSADGLTWNWGYRDSSQVNGDVIALHGHTTQIRSNFTRSLSPERSVSEEDINGGTFSLEVSSPVIPLGPFRLRAGFGYAFAQLENTSKWQALTARLFESISITRYTDAYSLGGITPPPAPYSGSYDGPGPLINRTPQRSPRGRNVTINRDVFRGDVNDAVELDLHTITLAPELSWTLGQFSVVTAAGLTINAVNWSGDHSEVLWKNNRVISRRSASDSSTEVLVGFTASVSGEMKLNERWSIWTRARWDSLPKLEASFDRSRIAADLSGWSVQAGLGFSF